MSICEHDLPPLSSLYSQSHTEERPSHETRAHRISRKRAITTHAIFTIINFLNYVDRFSIAAILSDVENYFKLDDTQKVGPIFTSTHNIHPIKSRGCLQLFHQQNFDL